jgi:fatty acid desaturase
MVDIDRSRRDYSLVGPEAALAVERGLANATWYSSEIPRKRLKELMLRSDSRAIRDTALWLGLLLVSGTLGVLLWGGWAAVPCFFVYGILYGSAADSRWHEAGHGTAFKTRWLDSAVYQLASFMMMREPTVWRWSHTRHHTDTLIVGRDPEIVAMRPPRLARILLNFFGLVDVPVALSLMVRHAFGGLTADESTFVPDPERPKIARTSRIWLAIYLAVLLTCVLTGSILPAVLIGLPRIYGTWLHLVFGLTQHSGLGEDVLDHRLNSRTVHLNPVFRFLYWNMNYHVEHHMFPMVPYHALPQLHHEMRADCPPPYPSLWAAYRELVPAVLRQLRDQNHFVYRQLPVGAREHPLRGGGEVSA